MKASVGLMGMTGADKSVHGVDKGGNGMTTEQYTQRTEAAPGLGLGSGLGAGLGVGSSPPPAPSGGEPRKAFGEALKDVWAYLDTADIKKGALALPPSYEQPVS